nr:LacI family DNA-binding transcriptional regulator [Leifsonia sp. Leaf325]
MSERRATMRDVASASGVSPATVSFVLNGVSDQTISPATRQRVEQAARELNYVPHGIARALREGSSRIVLLDLDPLFRGGGTESYVRGLEDELAQHGHVLLVHHDSAASRSSMQAVIDGVRPRAVISLSGLYGPERDAADDGGRVDGLAAHSAVQVRHLVDAGHSSIAFALPEGDRATRLSAARLRFAGEAARTLGVEAPIELRLAIDPTDAAARVSDFLVRHPQVTAIATFDDVVALRLLPVLRTLGITVPGRVAVIGFDDIEYGAFSTPALTSVHIDAEGFGRMAARRALGLDGESLALGVPARVIQRESA